MYNFEKFLPSNFNLNKNYYDKFLSELNKNKRWIYTASGRASLYHILRCNEVKKILIPTYICDTVLEPIKKLKIEFDFFDIDLLDLNPSFESFVNIYNSDSSFDAVLVASMYGNPADLIKFENFCKKNNILLIDDAAQSFGSTLNGRLVGTFGNNGFFSFSPGKPFAGHMGSFFWSNQNCIIRRKRKNYYHYFKWLYFKYTRVNIYKTNKILIFILNIANKFFEIFINTYYDDISDIDKKVIGGIFYSYKKNEWKYREIINNKFKLLANKKFKVINNIRGTSNNHKIVLVLESGNHVDSFKKLLTEHNIYYINGYKPLKLLNNMSKIDKRIFELPMENDLKKMDYLFELLKGF